MWKQTSCVKRCTSCTEHQAKLIFECPAHTEHWCRIFSDHSFLSLKVSSCLYTQIKTFNGFKSVTQQATDLGGLEHSIVIQLQSCAQMRVRKQKTCYLLHPAGRGSWACLWLARCKPQGGRDMTTGCPPGWDWSLQSTPPRLHCQTPVWATTAQKNHNTCII